MIFWGSAFVRGCPFAGMGWEARPTFWWANEQDDTNDEEEQTTADGLSSILNAMLTALAAMAGHTRGEKTIDERPLQLDELGVAQWKHFAKIAGQLKREATSHLEAIVGKHCFTSASHIIVCHLLRVAFETLKTNPGMLSRLMVFDDAMVNEMSTTDLAADFFTMQHTVVLTAPAHLRHVTMSMNTIFHEMSLPVDRRAGPPVVAISSSSTQEEVSYTSEEQASYTQVDHQV